MMVGMPGTGMGGLLYLCLAAWMPVHELWRLVRGRTSARRWAFIGRSWLVVGGSLACLWGAMVSFKALLPMIASWASKGGVGEGNALAALGSETNGMLASAAWASGIALALVVVLVHVLRLALWMGAKARRRHPVAGSLFNQAESRWTGSASADA